MIHRFTRTPRLAVLLFAASGVTALGCSLIVEFEESRIPADDVGVTTETGVPDTMVIDTGMPDPDTGTPPMDTGAPPTDGGDTGTPPTDTGTPPTDTGTPPIDTGTPPVDTGTPDTATPDTATPDTATPDTSVVDTAVDDVGADTAVADAVADVTDAGPTTMSFSSQLTPSQEIPPTTSSASGSATCVLTISTKALACTITHTVVAPTGAHLHMALPGRTAGIAHDLGTGVSPIVSTVTLSDAEVTQLTAGGFYINIHTTEFAAGAIRGQLLKPGETLYLADVKAASGVTTSGAGGFGLIKRTAGAYDYSGEVKNLNADTTAAHIHKVSDNSIVQGLTTPTTTKTSTTFAGSLASSALETTLLDGAGYYVNVHTDATMGGTAGGEVQGTINKIFTAP